jgi:hypothetical protein
MWPKAYFYLAAGTVGLGVPNGLSQSVAVVPNGGGLGTTVTDF